MEGGGGEATKFKPNQGREGKNGRSSLGLENRGSYNLRGKKQRPVEVYETELPVKCFCEGPCGISPQSREVREGYPFERTGNPTSVVQRKMSPRSGAAVQRERRRRHCQIAASFSIQGNETPRSLAR